MSCSLFFWEVLKLYWRPRTSVCITMAHCTTSLRLLSQDDVVWKINLNGELLYVGWLMFFCKLFLFSIWIRVIYFGLNVCMLLVVFQYSYEIAFIAWKVTYQYRLYVVLIFKVVLVYCWIFLLTLIIFICFSWAHLFPVWKFFPFFI